MRGAASRAKLHDAAHFAKCRVPFRQHMANGQPARLGSKDLGGNVTGATCASVVVANIEHLGDSYALVVVVHVQHKQSHVPSYSGYTA